MRKVVVLAMAGLCVHEGGAFAPPRVSRRPRHPQPRMLAALPSAALGGTFAGGLHAVTGPDHLAALLPLCVGRRWPRAAATGALWGIGHGLGAALIGALGFALRGGLNLDAVSVHMEVAVGISLMVIGGTWCAAARRANLVVPKIGAPMVGRVQPITLMVAPGGVRTASDEPRH